MPKKKEESGEKEKIGHTVQLERVPDEKPRKKKEKPKMTIEVVPVVMTFE
jgi:hypothetical protein